MVIDIGAVERQPLPADFNSDLAVDGFDFLTWQRGFGATSGASLSDGDANVDGAVDEIDLIAWQATSGQDDSSEAPPALLAASEQPAAASQSRLASRPDLVDAALATAWADRPGVPATKIAPTEQQAAAREAVFASDTSPLLPLTVQRDRSRHVHSEQGEPDDFSNADSSNGDSWLADESLDRLFG